MTALVHAQLVGLRTLRSTYLVAGILIAVVAIVTGVTMHEAGSADLRTESDLRDPIVAAAGIMGAIIMAVFAATRVAGEYRHETIAQRVLAAPRRARLVVASLVVHGAFAAVVTGAAFLVGAALAGPMLAGKDLTTGLSGGELLHVGAAVVLAGSSFGLLGVSVGFSPRSPAPAVAAVFGVFFAEQLLGGWLGDVGGYLPFALLNSLLEFGDRCPSASPPWCSRRSRSGSRYWRRCTPSAATSPEPGSSAPVHLYRCRPLPTSPARASSTARSPSSPASGPTG